MSDIKLDSRVGKTTDGDSYKLGNVKRISNGKALVIFDAGHSSWCNISNLEARRQ